MNKQGKKHQNISLVCIVISSQCAFCVPVLEEGKKEANRSLGRLKNVSAHIACDTLFLHTLAIPCGAIRHDNDDGNGLTGDVSPTPTESTSETIERNCRGNFTQREIAPE